MNKQQNVLLGAALVALGLIWWLNLSWLVWPAALIGLGAVAYQQRRQLGDTVAAVQAGLWLVGLGLLFLLNFVFPGVLFLAGASILARGREQRIDDRVQRMLGNLRNGNLRPNLPSQHVPVTSEPTHDRAASETTRL
ncbi:MAG: hypothetical protein H7Z42_12265 [Roseiflexaceae bacterium]|nr:hypothetical protein [Roseiflexaceae bacterium]